MFQNCERTIESAALLWLRDSLTNLDKHTSAPDIRLNTRTRDKYLISDIRLNTRTRDKYLISDIRLNTRTRDKLFCNCFFY